MYFHFLLNYFMHFYFSANWGVLAKQNRGNGGISYLNHIDTTYYFTLNAAARFSFFRTKF